jgi:hypothetical protein
VFDGYDNLDCDRLSRSRFRQVSKQLRSLVSSPTRAGIAMLVVCRTETLAQVANAWSLSTDRGISTVRLDPSPFYEVVINRIDRLIDWLDTVENAAETPEIGYEARTICLDFKSHFISKFDEGHFGELISLFPSNNRACVQMLSAEFSEFISNRKSTSGYRLIEMLTLAGFAYPPVIYDYFSSEDESLICNYNASEGVIPYDTRFLPIITRPPIPRKGKNLRAGRHFTQSSMLHGLRLLQLIELIQKTSHAASEGISIGTLRDILKDLFGYHRNVSAMLCYELEVYGCLKIHREYPERNASDDDEVYLMPKGHQIITSTLWDPAYLNLCAMRTILPREVHNLDLIRISQPFSSTHGIERQRLVSEWAVNKIGNSLGLLRMMNEVNERQATDTRAIIEAVCVERRDDIELIPAEVMEIFEETRAKLFAAIDPIVQLYRFLSSSASEAPFEPNHAAKSREVLRDALAAWVQA